MRINTIWQEILHAKQKTELESAAYKVKNFDQANNQKPSVWLPSPGELPDSNLAGRVPLVDQVPGQNYRPHDLPLPAADA